MIRIHSVSPTRMYAPRKMQSNLFCLPSHPQHTIKVSETCLKLTPNPFLKTSLKVFPLSVNCSNKNWLRLKPGHDS